MSVRFKLFEFGNIKLLISHTFYYLLIDSKDIADKDPDRHSFDTDSKWKTIISH